MAAFAAPGGRIRLIRNHEIDLDTGAFGSRAGLRRQAPAAARPRVEFDPASGAFVKAWASLCGTTRNCAGGPTPWGSWLTCEETLVEPRPANQFRQPHGYVFEVPSEGAATAVPLKGLGRFVHEAIAIDPSTGIVYLTEDHGAAGFYRFVPKTPGTLVEGGRLEMLAVDARPRFDTRMGQRSGHSLPVHWVPIADPDRPHRVNDLGDAEGVSSQGREQGAAIFARLEGAWYGGGSIFFDATSGGNAGSGQIWEYVPSREQLRLVFESPGPHVLNKPDNLTVSPRGGLAICEDGAGRHAADPRPDARRPPVPLRSQQRRAQRRTPRLPRRLPRPRVHRRDLQPRRPVDVLQHPDARDDLCGDGAVGAGETVNCRLQIAD